MNDQQLNNFKLELFDQWRTLSEENFGMSELLAFAATSLHVIKDERGLDMLCSDLKTRASMAVNIGEIGLADTARDLAVKVEELKKGN